jgi:hypothetical protein
LFLKRLIHLTDITVSHPDEYVPRTVFLITNKKIFKRSNSTDIAECCKNLQIELDAVYIGSYNTHDL